VFYSTRKVEGHIEESTFQKYLLHLNSTIIVLVVSLKQCSR